MRLFLVGSAAGVDGSSVPLVMLMVSFIGLMLVAPFFPLTLLFLDAGGVLRLLVFPEADEGAVLVLAFVIGLDKSSIYKGLHRISTQLRMLANSAPRSCERLLLY
eukprot:12687898-Ditylum_brightwellii.AAC.1